MLSFLSPLPALRIKERIKWCGQVDVLDILIVSGGISRQILYSKLFDTKQKHFLSFFSFSLSLIQIQGIPQNCIVQSWYTDLLQAVARMY